MKSFAGFRYTMSLEFADGRDITVSIDGHGLIYNATEYSYLSYLESSNPDYQVDHWQATA